MTCDGCRTAVSEGREPAPVSTHLRGCEDCRTWVEGLAAVRAHAPALVGAAPEGLSDRVLAHVATLPPVVVAADEDPAVADADRAAASLGATASPPRRWWQRATDAWGVPRLAAAGAAGVLAASLVVAQVGGGTPPGAGPADAVLAAAAHALHSTDAQGFSFEVDGQMTATFAFPRLDPPPVAEPPRLPLLPGIPELPAVPDLSTPGPGIRFDCSVLPAGLVARCELEVAEGGRIDASDVRAWLREQTEAARRSWEDRRAEVRDRINDALRDARDELTRATGEAFAFTEEMRVLRVRYDGTGQGDGRGNASASIAYTFDAPVDATGTLDVISVGAHTYVRSGGQDTWVRLAGRYDGFRFDELTSPRDPHQLLEALTDHDGPITELGERELDGVRVRGLRIVRDGATVTAWVGVEDGLLRELDHRRSIGGPEGTRVESRTTIRIRDVGARVQVEPPSSWTDLGEALPQHLPPFHAPIDLDVRIGAAVRM